MGELGRALLLIGLGVAAYGIGASLYGVRRRRPDWVHSGRRAVYALAALMVMAFALLEVAFVRNEFSFKVVAQTSSTTIPIFYKLTAPWSSQQGSLLLWVMLSSFWSSAVVLPIQTLYRDSSSSIRRSRSTFEVSSMIFGSLMISPTVSRIISMVA